MYQFYYDHPTVHRVSKTSHLWLAITLTRELILIFFFVRNVTAKVSHLYSTGQTSCWASAHILVPTMFMLHKRKVFKVTLRFLPWCHCSSLAVTNVDYCTDYSAEKWMKSVWPLILLKTLKWVCSFCYGRPME